MQDLAWIVPAALLLLPFFFMASLSHDRLVRRLYELHREEWTRAGCPHGFFWRPSEPLPRGAPLAFVKASITWAFRLPRPLAEDPEARRPLLMLRIGLAVWNVGGFALFGMIIARHGLG